MVLAGQEREETAVEDDSSWFESRGLLMRTAGKTVGRDAGQCLMEYLMNLGTGEHVCDGVAGLLKAVS